MLGVGFLGVGGGVHFSFRGEVRESTVFLKLKYTLKITTSLDFRKNTKGPFPLVVRTKNSKFRNLFQNLVSRGQ